MADHPGVTTALAPRRVRPPGPARLLDRGGSVLAVAAASALLWLPNLARPLASDEGGFLLVASQWSPGTSLYGDYWVDRPPLLIGLFQLADLAGGLLALRVLGLLAVVASVLLAGRVGRLVAPGSRHAATLTAATAAVFLCTPLFGTSEVDGELLAVPFVLASFVAAMLGVRTRRPSWWAAAGAAAVAAPLVKQSMVDGFVLAAVLVVWLLVGRRVRDAGAAVLGFVGGVAACLGLVLVWAAFRGTDPGGLWDAVVVFRGEAASVISSEANAATPHRAVTLLSSFLLSGALVVLVAALLPGLRRRSAPPPYAGLPDARVLALAVLGWEAVAIGFGGSYWLHYLIGLVPGLVLAAATVAARRPTRTRWVATGLAYATVVAAIGTIGLEMHDRSVPSDVAVARYLADHEESGDTAVVAFGNPAILEASGLTSPYPELWSLPVRVRDPHLTELTRVLTGPDRPTWIVVSGATLTTWGVDDSTAQPVVDRDYRLVDTDGDYRIYRLDRSTGTG